MKQTIEEAAETQFTKSYTNYKVRRMGFITGAKSEAAKEFHTQGMYSEEEVKKILSDLRDNIYLESDAYVLTDEWFEEYKKKKNGIT